MLVVLYIETYKGKIYLTLGSYNESHDIKISFRYVLSERFYVKRYHNLPRVKKSYYIFYNLLNLSYDTTQKRGGRRYE